MSVGLGNACVGSGNVCLWDQVMHLCVLVWAMYVCGSWQCMSVGSGNVSLCVGPSNALGSVGLGCAFVGLGNVCPWNLATHLHLWALKVYVDGFWQLVSVEPSNAYLCLWVLAMYVRGFWQ